MTFSVGGAQSTYLLSRQINTTTMASSSSSSSPFALTLSSQSSRYHVFLSFRGVDTRKTFVDHLYSALEEKGIYTYKDDETLARGELLSSSLMKAVGESYIAVVIFSKNYANSSWCLDELAYIMKCWDTKGKIVIPIFYNVKPSTVRKQKWKYAIAFFKHKLRNKKKVECWRKALVDASNISGWVTKHTANGHESKCIKVIVDAVLERLHRDTSSVKDILNDNLIGTEAPMQLMISNLKIGLGGVRMVGIWGVGGSGKTTLASMVYEKIAREFDCSLFLENIRKESSTNGLEILQEKMLSGLLRQQHVHVRRVEKGRHMMRDRLSHRKVLIVLDDVNDLDQLRALAGSELWFGEGSRIIITTRNESVLVAHRVHVIQHMYSLNYVDAVKLFCKHAPRNARPIEEYELLSKGVVSYVGGLPLALTILGRFLCDKDIDVWRSALARLKEFPYANILEKLKISFDGLEPVEKRLFLDIACFFRLEHTHEPVKMMLDNGDFHNVKGIKVLLEKGLISISDRKFVMHNLLQEMAHYINREQQHNYHHKDSRVLKKENGVNICVTNAMMVGANKKNIRYIKQRVTVARWLCKKDPPKELSGLPLSDLVQKQLWEGYKADDSDMLLTETNERMDYHNSVTRLDCGTSHGYDQTTDSDEKCGDRRLIPVPKDTEIRNDRIEREILKRLEKGKSNVEMEVVETEEDRIVNRMEGLFHERMDRLENKMVERMDMMENRMARMEGMVVKRMKRLTINSVEMEGGIVHRMERLTNKMAELEEGVVDTFDK